MSLEISPLLLAVTRAFERRDDLESIERVKASSEDVKKRYAKQQMELRDIIQAYSGKVDQIEQSVQVAEENLVQQKGELMQKQQQLEVQKRAVAQRRTLVDVEAQRVAELTAEEELAAQKANSVQVTQEDVAVPKIKHALSLYANISNIRWDFSAYEYGRVKGFIAVKDDDDPLRPFDFNFDQGSARQQFTLTNEIWKLMETKDEDEEDEEDEDDDDDE